MEQQYQFGQFRLDPDNERLWRGCEEIILRPKSFAVLAYLVARPGRLISREDLLQAIWPGITVSDAVLTVCIGEIRQAMRDDRHAPQYIETLHRRGYRFLGTVTTIPETMSTSATSSLEPMPPRDTPVSAESFAFSTDSIPSPQSAVLTDPRSAFNMIALVGREAPLSRLEGCMSQARVGRRQVVFVTGEAGIGKTTLVQTFLTRAMSAEPLWVARGQCMAHYGAAEPYLPVLDGLGRLCREEGSASFRAGLRRYAPTWLSQMPTLLDAVNLEALQDRPRVASRQRMLRELAEAIEVLTQERPLLLVLEDLHWSDFATLDLVTWLAQRQEPARLLVLGTYRPVDVIVRGHPLQTVKPELMRHQQCAELSLELLTAAEIAQYLAGRFPVDPSATALLQRLAQVIYQRTDGHPLFMVTLVDTLVQQERLARQHGLWTLQGGAEKVAAEVPESLQQLVEQQLDQLGAADQHLLEAASVAGMRFSAAAVAAGLQEPVETVEDWCSTLARRGQMLQTSGVEEWPDGTVASCYRFRHILYRQVVYDRLPVGRRALLHARLGVRLEVGYQELAVEHAAELATHFEQGREHSKAVYYLQLAVEKALQRYAYQEAISLLNRGLTALSKLPETSAHQTVELDLRITLGQVLTVTQGPGTDAVAAVYRRAEELCQQVGNVGQRIAVLRGQRRGAQGRGEPEKARPLAEEFLRLARERPGAALLIEGHVALGICLFYLGQLSMARAHLQEGLALYEAQYPHIAIFPAGQDFGVLALAYDAMALWMLGYPEQARQRSRRALDLAVGVTHPWAMTMARGYGALIQALCRDHRAALEHAEATVHLATEHGVASWIGRGTMLRGWALTEQGRAPDGVVHMRQGFADWHANGEELGKPLWLGFLGQGCANAGRIGEGLQIIAEALAMAQGRELRFWESELHRLQGELLLRQAGELGSGPSAIAWGPSTTPAMGAISLSAPCAEAEACFHQALDHAQRWQARSLELRAAMSLSRLWQRQGKKRAARRLLEERYRWFAEGLDTADLQEASALLQELVG